MSFSFIDYYKLTTRAGEEDVLDNILPCNLFRLISWIYYNVISINFFYPNKMTEVFTLTADVETYNQYVIRLGKSNDFFRIIRLKTFYYQPILFKCPFKVEQRHIALYAYTCFEFIYELVYCHVFMKQSESDICNIESTIKMAPNRQTDSFTSLAGMYCGMTTKRVYEKHTSQKQYQDNKTTMPPNHQKTYPQGTGNAHPRSATSLFKNAKPSGLVAASDLPIDHKRPQLLGSSEMASKVSSTTRSNISSCFSRDEPVL